MTIDPREEDALRGRLAALTRTVQAAPDLYGGVLRRHRRRRQRVLVLGAAAAVVLAGGAVAVPAAVLHRHTAGRPAPAAVLVLTARTTAGNLAGGAALEQASRLLRQRLAAAGIPIATVRVGGGEILVTVPSDRVTDAQRAAIRGAMLFRPVREAFPAALPGAGNPDPYPGASMVERVMLTGLDCGKPAATVVDPTRAMAACSADGRTKYMLGPALFAATEIAAATAEGPAPDRGVFEWRVAVRLKPAAQAVWSQWTRGHLGSAVGIALDDRVLSAPVIASTISGATPFAADFTEDTAKSLAVVLSHGPLPVTLRLVAVGH